MQNSRCINTIYKHFLPLCGLPFDSVDSLLLACLYLNVNLFKDFFVTVFQFSSSTFPLSHNEKEIHYIT